MFERRQWPWVLPFAAYMAFIAVADVLERAGVDGATLRWLYPVKIAVVGALLWTFRRHYTELPRRWPGLAALALSALAGVLTLWLWLHLDAGWMRVGQSAGFDPRRDGRVDWLLAALRLAGAALVVPVMEELFWRSFLSRWLISSDFQNVNPARLSARAFVVTVVLFGFEHELWLAGIVAGAIYGWLYMRSRDLWSPILAHSVTNGLLGVWIISTGNWTYW